MSAYYYTLIVINMQESKYPRGCAACVAMFYSCLSGVLNSSKKNRLLQLEAYATRAFYLSASESKGTIWAAMGQGKIHLFKSLTLLIYRTPLLRSAMSCKACHEFHSQLSVVTHLLFSMPSGFWFVFYYSFIWQS